MGRSYNMRTRARAAAGTRGAIVDAAHRLLDQRGRTALTLQEVAAAAAVSRATIYKSIGSRTQVLAAVFEDQGRLIGFDRVLAAMAMDDPDAAAIATVRESCRAWSVMPEAIRKTLALSALDAEIAALVHGYERHRRARLTVLARRVCRAGATGMRPRVRDAAATLALATSFAAFDQLRIELDTRQATDLLVQLTSTSLGLCVTPVHARDRTIRRPDSR
jgi:AcrR family transcriptional regulator